MRGTHQVADAEGAARMIDRSEKTWSARRIEACKDRLELCVMDVTVALTVAKAHDALRASL